MALGMSDLKKGMKIEVDGIPYRITDYAHVKPGKGAAFVRCKIKSLLNGKVIDKTFHAGDKCETPNLENKTMQYLYNDGELYYFMDTETYDQIPLNFEQVKEAMKFIRENDMASMRFHEGKPFEVSPPNFVELEVTETEPGMKGDTATGATKQATVETGTVVLVPLFINIGDKLKIDTRTGEYLSRV